VGLEHQSSLLTTDPVAQANLNAAITNLKTTHALEKDDKKKDAIAGQVEVVAKGLEGFTAASISLSKAVKSGDPIAISMQSLALVGSVVAIVGAATPPNRHRGRSNCGSRALHRLYDSSDVPTRIGIAS
jgi:hypothetical protein